MPRVQHVSDKVLDYFRTADLGQVELVLHWVRLIVKERQPKKAAGAVRTRKAKAAQADVPNTAAAFDKQA